MSYSQTKERAGRYNSLRLLGHDYSNTKDEYFITICTNAGSPFFADIELAKQVTSLILDMHFGGMVQLFVFVLMPDHVHAVLKNCKADLSIPVVLGYFKSKATRLYWKRARSILQSGIVSSFGRRSDAGGLESLKTWACFNPIPEVVKINNLRPPSVRIFQRKRLWQEKFHDHVIRSDAEFDEKVEYSLENPVRRGYVTEAWMYPFSVVLLPEGSRKTGGHRSRPYSG